MTFIEITFLDVLDVFLTAFLFYNVYILIRRTVAIRIFVALVFLYFSWFTAKSLNMKLLGGILGHVTGLGVLAIIIVFQQEIRKFFLLVSNKYLSRAEEKFRKIFGIKSKHPYTFKIWSVASACAKMSKKSTGALIVLQKGTLSEQIIDSGRKIDAITSSLLLQSIFFKNSPLHDGAVIISKERIVAAGCILPLSSRKDLPKSFGLRHRAAAGLAEVTDCIIISLSEERGEISCFYHDEYKRNLTITELRKLLESKFGTNENTNKLFEKTTQRENAGS